MRARGHSSGCSLANLFGFLIAAGTEVAAPVFAGDDLRSVAAAVRDLDAQDPATRMRAAQTVRSARSIPDDVLPMLVDALDSTDEQVADLCVELLLRERQRSVAVLTQRLRLAQGKGKRTLRHLTSRRLERAIDVVRRCGPDAIEVAPLRDYARDADTPIGVRVCATRALCEVDSSYRPQLVLLLQEATRMEDELGMSMAADSIGDLMVDPALAINPLLEALGCDPSTRRISSVAHQGLASARRVIGMYGRTAIPELARALAQPRLQDAASWVLAELGVDVLDSVRVLLRDSGRPATQVGAALTLGRMGESAGVAREDLERVLAQARGGLLQAALTAHWRIFGETDAVSRPYVRVLTDPSPEIRREAALQVRLLGKSGRFALPYLKALIHDPDEKVRNEAAEAIQVIGDE